MIVLLYLQDREGIVKQIYRGVVFALDENEVENGGYFCFKAQLCEKVKLAEEIPVGKVLRVLSCIYFSCLQILFCKGIPGFQSVLH